MMMYKPHKLKEQPLQIHAEEQRTTGVMSSGIQDNKIHMHTQWGAALLAQ